MRDRYSKAVEGEDGEVVQVTEFIKDELAINIVREYEGKVIQKSMVLTEDEVFILSGILNEWAKQKKH